eukprot:GHUV01037075.1.p1 GENE.GHUV01037075.1~~GHUV01037075.1.p1  ORF type:complete len:172 (-),score=15.07 GHUV01037075.1:565-1080(-)
MWGYSELVCLLLVRFVRIFAQWRTVPWSRNMHVHWPWFCSTKILTNSSSCATVSAQLCCTGLQSLQATIVSAPPAATSGLIATWSASMNGTPCHDVDPNCRLCALGQPPALCGTLMTNTTGPPTYYCNAQGVACKEGRVNAVNASWSGLVFSQLPPGLGQLMKLQELGKPW